MIRVLVVEDDADVRSALVEDLTERNYAVRATGEAWAALREVADGRRWWCWISAFPTWTAASCSS